jgi:hypothetical protein
MMANAEVTGARVFAHPVDRLVRQNLPQLLRMVNHNGGISSEMGN